MATPELLEKFNKMREVLSQNILERDDEIRGILTAMISKSNILLIGPPGTAKSYLVVLTSKLIKNANYFEKLLTKFTTPDEVIGPFSLKEIENDNYVRKLEGYIATSNLTFLDEVFKSNSALLNALLTIMNERKITNGTEVIEIPLFTLIGASNEIPEESDGLDALYDRFNLRYIVKPIHERENQVKMLMGKETNISPIITIKEIQKAQEECAQVIFPEELASSYTEVMDVLRKDGLSATDRTYRSSINLLKANAYLAGRDTVTEEDFDILQHALWTNPDHKSKIYSHVLKTVNPMLNKITILFEDAQLEMESLYKDKSGALGKSMEVAEKLRKIKATMHEYFVQFKKEGKETANMIKGFENKVDKMIKDALNLGLTI